MRTRIIEFQSLSCKLKCSRLNVYTNKVEDLFLFTSFVYEGWVVQKVQKSVYVVVECPLYSNFRYDLLDMLLQEGGDPNVEGRDGSLPLMVCLVPLVNRDHLHHFTHTMKVCYLNCVRILLKYGANPNCSSRSNLTPLHVLNFAATENISLSRDEDKAQGFEFVRNLLTLLLNHGLDPNVRFSQRSNHILLSLMDMVQNARQAKDLTYVYDLTLTLITYGANPNVIIDDPSQCVEDHDYASVPPTPPPSKSRGGQRCGFSSNGVGGGSDRLNSYPVSPKNLVIYHYVQLLMRKNQLWVNDAELHFARILR